MNDIKPISVLLLSLFSKISKRRKLQIPILGLLMLIGIFSEVASIGLVIPFLSILTNPSGILEYDIANYFYDFFQYQDPLSLLFPITIIFLSFIVLANILRLTLYWATTKFVYAIGHELATEVFSGTVHQPYNYHLYTNSSEIIGAVNKAQIIVGNVLLPFIRLIISFCIIISVSITLMVINPKIFYVAFISIAMTYLIISFFTKALLRANSKIISRNQSLRVKELQEALGGIREIILDSSHQYHIKKFSDIEFNLRSSQAKNLIIGDFPRYIIESIGIVGISTFAYISVNPSYGIDNVIPLIGALALGAQKLLPLIHQVYAGWANINGNHLVLNDVIDLLNRKQPQNTNLNGDKINFSDKISLTGVNFKYKNIDDYVLKDINLSIKKGEKIGIIGKTGSGKSSLVDIIMSFLEPSEGVFKIDDVEINSSNRKVWQSKVAHVPQSIFLVDGTIAENISLTSNISDNNLTIKLEEASKKAMLDEFVQLLPDGYDTIVGERGVRLSGGQIQRIGIARALYKNPSILILDEATSALDNVTEKEIIESIKNLQDELTVLTIAHRLTTLYFCDKIIKLDKGKIVDYGSYDKVIRLKN